MNSYSFTLSKRFAQKNIGVTLLLVMVAVYFSFYTIYGGRGVFTLHRLNNDIREAQATLDELVAEREEIETHVTMMRPESVDIDMMSEQIRKQMEYAHPADIVIRLK